MNTKGDFNKNHPERRDDEVFITNSDDEFDFESGTRSYRAIEWRTKRRGNISYDSNGKPLGDKWPESFPVFVKQEEIRMAEDGEEILKSLLP